jgi:hypothetical protein
MVHRKMDNPVRRRILLEGAWRAYDPPFVRPLGARAPQTRLSRAATSVVILVLSLGLWVVIWEALNKAAYLL